MTEQQKPKAQKPKAQRVVSGEPGYTAWDVSYLEAGHKIFIDQHASADELRAIAGEMEKDELRKLHQVWQNEAQQAWRTPGNNASAPVWYVTGFLAAKEIDYRERVGLPQKGESHVD